MLKINNLKIEREGSVLIEECQMHLSNGVNLLQGANGSGKTSFMLGLFKHPKYQCLEREIYLDEEDISELQTHELAKKGLYLAMQMVPEISGIKLNQFLFKVYKNLHGEISANDFAKLLFSYCDEFNIDRKFLERDLNVGLSGGEKKQVELLHLLIAKPKYAFLDEIDSGVDYEGVLRIAKVIQDMSETTFLIITHGVQLKNLLSINNEYLVLDKKIYRKV